MPTEEKQEKSSGGKKRKEQAKDKQHLSCVENKTIRSLAKNTFEHS